MKPRSLASIIVIAALVTIVAYDVTLRRAMNATRKAQGEVATRAAEIAQKTEALAQEIKAAQTKLETGRSRSSSAPAAAAANSRAAAPQVSATASTPNSSAARISSAVIAENAESRAIRVRTYVAERRLMFGPWLKQLGLTPAQLDRFDAIQAEYQQGILDLAASSTMQGLKDGRALAPVRTQLTQARDTALRDLFGDGYPAWETANRIQGPWAVAAQLLQQTVPAMGPIDASTMDQLVNVVAKHPKPDNGSSYDWNAIAADAGAALSGRQLETVRTACAFWQASDEMYAIAGKR